MTSIISSSTGRTYRGQTPEQRAAERRRRFLEAGLQLFGTIGLRAVTVRRICREAGLTDRYFYESFDTMESLLVAVYEHHLGLIMEKMIAVISASNNVIDDGNGLRDLTQYLLDAFYLEMENPLVSRVCMFEVEGVSPAVHQLYNRYISTFASIIVETAKRYCAPWPLNKQETEVIGQTLVGGITQNTRNWVASEYKTARADMVRGTQLVFEGTLMQVKLLQNQ